MSVIRFLGLDFKLLSLEDQPVLSEFLERYPNRLSGYTFASLMAWTPIYKYAWAFLTDDTLLISAVFREVPHRHLYQPIGLFSKECQKALLDAITALDYPLKLVAVSPEFLGHHPSFCSHFTDLDDRRFANYIYRTEDLATLYGRHYAKKRNLIAQAEEFYRWTAEPLTAMLQDDCRHILEDIEENEHPLPSKDREDESIALNYMMEHFATLRPKGCLIRIEGVPAAFSVYEAMTPTTAVVYFEKAERQYKGLYQLVNRETAKAIFQEGFAYINREEDLGNEGLRQAKMSYHPIDLVHFHVLSYIKHVD